MKERTASLLKQTGTFLTTVAAGFIMLWTMDTTSDKLLSQRESRALSQRFSSLVEAGSYTPIDIYEAGEEYKNITAAYAAERNGETAGYIIELTESISGTDIPFTAVLSPKGDRVLSMTSDCIGTALLSQFSKIKIPVTLDSVRLEDGVYHARSEADTSGYVNTMQMTVEKGRISKVYWDAVRSDGVSKRQTSLKGEYVMTSDAPLWHEQAAMLENRLIELQDPRALYCTDDGRTDAVTGVSIKISPFIGLALDCYSRAGGKISGTGIKTADISPGQACADAANDASDFVRNFILLDEKPVGGDAHE